MIATWRTGSYEVKHSWPSPPAPLSASPAGQGESDKNKRALGVDQIFSRGMRPLHRTEISHHLPPVVPASTSA
jgi:hypothetical protein